MRFADNHALQSRLFTVHGGDRAFVALASGMPFAVSSLVPEGHLIVADYGGGRKVFGGAFTIFSLTHNGHWPLESFYSRGCIELARDRRRHGKANSG